MGLHVTAMMVLLEMELHAQVKSALAELLIPCAFSIPVFIPTMHVAASFMGIQIPT